MTGQLQKFIPDVPPRPIRSASRVHSRAYSTHSLSVIVALPVLGQVGAKPSLSHQRLRAEPGPVVVLQAGNKALVPPNQCRAPLSLIAVFPFRPPRSRPFNEYTPFCNGPGDVKFPRVIVTPPSSRFCPWSTLRPPHCAVRGSGEPI